MMKFLLFCDVNIMIVAVFSPVHEVKSEYRILESGNELDTDVF